MKLSQFRFDLPLNLIAQNPTKKREDSRMMVIHRKTGAIENRNFRDIIEYFDDKDVMVVNNTKVFPARMYGRKEKTGAICTLRSGAKASITATDPFGRRRASTSHSISDHHYIVINHHLSIYLDID